MRGHVFVDDEGCIVVEYCVNFSARGQLGLGDVFLKWFFIYEWGG